MEQLREAPNAAGFVPLSEHQSSTPSSFFSGPPVLHYYSDRCKVLVLERELGDSAALAAFCQHSQPVARDGSTAVNGDATEHDIEDDETTKRVVEEVDVWVTSEKLLLYQSGASIGLSIPYRSIALHAIQSFPQPPPAEQQGVYMQIISSTNEPSNEDDEPDSISLTIIPTASAPPPAATETDPAEDQPEQTPVMAMFTALSNCSNLHPDPIDPSEQEDGITGSRLFQAGMLIPGEAGGGLPPAMPGSGGWITAENMQEYFDEDGNWIGGEEEMEEAEETMGPGAGSVRPREERETAEEDGEGGEENHKWQRTS